MNPRVVVILTSILVVAGVWFAVAMSGSKDRRSHPLPATGARPTISTPAPGAPVAGPAGSAGSGGSATSTGTGSVDQEDVSEGDVEDEAQPSKSGLPIVGAAVPARIVPSLTPLPIPMPSPSLIP